MKLTFLDITFEVRTTNHSGNGCNQEIQTYRVNQCKTAKHIHMYFISLSHLSVQLTLTYLGGHYGPPPLSFF